MKNTFGCQIAPDGRGINVRGGCVSADGTRGDVDGIIEPGQAFYNVTYEQLEAAAREVGSITVTIDD